MTDPRHGDDQTIYHAEPSATKTNESRKQKARKCGNLRCLSFFADFIRRASLPGSLLHGGRIEFDKSRYATDDPPRNLERAPKSRVSFPWRSRSTRLVRDTMKERKGF